MKLRNLPQDLPAQYQGWGTETIAPLSPDFEHILARVPGMTTANVLQLLNWAVAGLEGDEIYCEIGTYLGSTLIGALWQHPEVTAWAVDNFAEYNPQGDNGDRLWANLEQFELTDQVCFFDQDFEAFFADFRELPDPPKIGVYFYDGAHDYRSTLMGLLSVTPFLAEQAFIILDDYNWQSVQQAAWDFLALHPQGQSLVELHTPIARYPTFWNGIQVIAWDRQRSVPLDPQILRQKRQPQLIRDLYDLQMQEQRAEQVKGLLYEAFHWHEAQDWERAESAYSRYLDQRLEDGSAWLNLGILYYTQTKIDRAESCFQKALSLGIEHPTLYLNLGNCAVQRGSLEEAIGYYHQGQDRYPEMTDFADNLTIVSEAQAQPGAFYGRLAQQHLDQNHYQAAHQAFSLATQFGYHSENLYVQWVECLLKLSPAFDPQPVLEDAATRFPHNEFLAFHWVTHLIRRGDPHAFTIAAACAQQQPESFTLRLFAQLGTPLLYDSEAELEPHYQRYRQNLQHLLDTLDLSTPDRLDAALMGIRRFNNFYLTYQGRNLVAEQRQYGILIHRILQARYPQWTQPLPMPAVTGKIRVGYASSYLHSYSGTFWLTGWLKHCDRQRFEIYCYYTGHTPDPITDFFREQSDVFHHIPDFEAVCEQIRQDQLHILVYPEIGMDGNTITQAALRLAPVQCTAWGHPLTSGLPSIDYYLSSTLMEPVEAQSHYTERLVRLPHLGIAYRQPPLPDPLPKTRADFGLTDSDRVYLCCQAPFKYLPQFDVLLVNIAARVPAAKFVFLRADGLKPRLTKAFAAASLQLENYALFLPGQDRPDYLALNCLSDVYLDTIGFTGGNMTFDALACALPVVTLPVPLMRGRLSVAMLQRIGITETIAQTLEEYIELAVMLGLNTSYRQHLKERIGQRCHLLFDDRACVVALEAFYRTVTTENQIPMICK